MSMKHIAETFDIHGGGADLIFPHHENELAQSEAFSGRPFVKYWVHNGFITIDKEKMSKSLGNFFTIREILDKFDPEAVRFFLLSTHYRSPIEFSDESLREAELSIDRYYTTVVRIQDFLREGSDKVKESTEERALEELLATLMNRFRDAMDDDFNTALALGHIFELIREVNRFLDTKPSGPKAKELIEKTLDLLRQVGGILNIFNRKPGEWYDALMVTKRIPYSKQDILTRIQARQDARKCKDWATADLVRKELEEHGVILEDKRDGTTWKVRVSKETPKQP
jgi:cysteinyl-tRNA synthetase